MSPWFSLAAEELRFEVPWSYQACGAKTGTRRDSPAFQVVAGSGIFPVCTVTPAAPRPTPVVPSPKSRWRVTLPVPVSVGRDRERVTRSWLSARSIWARVCASGLAWALASRSASCQECRRALAGGSGRSIGSSTSGNLGSTGVLGAGSAAAGDAGSAGWAWAVRATSSEARVRGIRRTDMGNRIVSIWPRAKSPRGELRPKRQAHESSS